MYLEQDLEAFHPRLPVVMPERYSIVNRVHRMTPRSFAALEHKPLLLYGLPICLLGMFLCCIFDKSLLLLRCCFCVLISSFRSWDNTIYISSNHRFLPIGIVSLKLKAVIPQPSSKTQASGQYRIRGSL